MPGQKIENFIKKLILRLELKVGKLGMTPFFIGNHAEDLLLDHFDASEYLETLGVSSEIVSIEKADTLLIVGALNLNQKAFLKAFVSENPEHFELIIHIKGPLAQRDIENSFFLTSDMSDFLAVDITYDRFPIVPKELLSKIRDFQLERAS